MMLNLTQVLLEDKRIETEVPVGFDRLEFSFGSFPAAGKTPVRLMAKKDEQGRLVIEGKALIEAEIPCDRCLDSVTVPLELDFRETVPVKADSPDQVPEESEEADDEIGPSFDPDCFLEGYHLDVDKLLFGEALLNWPSRVLCKEDCRGLCPVCGQNLNHGDCGCERKALDPRMAKVLDVFSKCKGGVDHVDLPEE